MELEDGIIMIHGKRYKTVARRVYEFRCDNGKADGWGILTEEIPKEDPNTVVFKAWIVDPEGRTVAVGHAEERRDANKINRTSAMEVCETSAIGRSLAALGYAGSEYASADEVINAISQQERSALAPVVQKPKLTQVDKDRRRIVISELLADIGLSYDLVAAYCQSMGLADPAELEGQRAHKMVEYFKTDQGNQAITKFMQEH